MSANATVSRRSVRSAIALALALALAGQTLAGESLQVDVTGLTDELLANTRASLKIIQYQEDEALEAEQIRNLHEAATQDIHRALEPFGFYRPSITAELSAPETGGVPWRASYKVDPGRQVPITEIDLQITGAGASDTGLLSLTDNLSLRKETVLDHRHYETAKRTLLEQIRELGYLDVEYSMHRVEVDLAAYTATVRLHIVPGARYVFGDIELDQDLFAPEYLAHYLILQPGEPFRQSLISQQRIALSKSGHFQEVAVEPGAATPGEPPAIPLHIRLAPYKANRYRGRIGWGTDTDFGVQADWTRRYIGRHGHHFNLGGAVVQDRNRLAADSSYVIPLNPLSGQDIELAVRHESKDLTYEDVDLLDGGETRIATNLASVFWHLPDRRFLDFELRSTVGFSLVGEDYDVFEVLFGHFPDEAQEDFIENLIDNFGPEAYETMVPDFEALAPVARFSLRRSDDPLYIRRGDYYQLELLWADESLGSNISFWQARLNTWNIWPMGDSGRLLLRSAVGYSDAETRTVLGVNFNQMPEYYEFRTGGARSVRGYGYETVFSTDTITGGKHQLVASVEYEREFIPDWSAAIFLDGGNAFNDFDHIDEKLGAGIGLRWRSPVGLARIDLGFPLDDADDSFQIYITVGPEF